MSSSEPCEGKTAPCIVESCADSSSECCADVQPGQLNPFADIEHRLGYSFKDPSWLERAFTHRSANVAHSCGNYERLEFIGDAVFDLAVAHLLSDRYPDASEGELSKMRAALVKGASFASIAKRLSLGEYIKLSRSELSNGANNRSSILSDVLEAVLGAVYLDGGFEVARECISRLLSDEILTVVPRDPKTELQELLHAANAAPPVYRLECTEGPEHSPVFISNVEVYGRILGRGRGSTKKASQQAAAEEALAKIGRNAKSGGAIPEPPVPVQESTTELVQEEAREDDRSE